MRTSLSLLAAVGALAFAGAASAETISLIWQVSGTNVTVVPSSSTITADIVLEVTSTNLSAIGWNISWNGELAILNTSVAAPPGGFVAGTDWRNTSDLSAPGSNPGSPGTHRVYQFSADPGLHMTPGIATVGTITFHVTAAVTGNGTPSGVSSNAPPPPPISGDVSADFLDKTDGVGCWFSGVPGPCTVIIGAQVNVPEPHTVALLALGLAGLGLAGQRRRS